jgi:hypothetical protein
MDSESTLLRSAFILIERHSAILEFWTVNLQYSVPLTWTFNPLFRQLLQLPLHERYILTTFFNWFGLPFCIVHDFQS